MNLDTIKEIVSRLSPEDQQEIDELLMTDAPLWVPLAGKPQEQAYNSHADIIGMGGSAGGGKSELAIGMALIKHKHSIIFRREGVQLKHVLFRLEEILSGKCAYRHNSQDHIWRLPDDRIIEYGGVNNLGDERKYQGRPHDFKVFDEVTEFLEIQVRFLMGWLRSPDPSMHCQVLMTFNPPTTAEGRWVIDYFAAWLKKDHPNPAKPGELRWYTADPKTGKDVECDGPEEIELEGELVTPRSRTFIPATVDDNPYYLDSGYKAQLQALPEPLRSMMLKGDFMAGVADDPFQVIPTHWVDLAQDRWKEIQSKADFKLGEMDSIGVDVARGGRDETIIARRYGKFFGELVCHSGTETPDGPTVASYVVKELRDQAPVHIDVIGCGASPYDFLKKSGIQTLGIDNRNTSYGVSREGGLRFINVRAETYWRLREALDPENGDDICLPPDPKLLGDLCALKWLYKKGGIQAELKDEVIKRLGRSPDRGDAVVLANIDTMKTDTWEKLAGGNKAYCGGEPYKKAYWEG